jgi:hypothetical protein
VKISEKPLLEVLSDNFLKHAQINTAVVQQEEMDRVVGFEPTTSAMLDLRRASALYLKSNYERRTVLLKSYSRSLKNMYWKAIGGFVILLENYTARWGLTIPPFPYLSSIFIIYVKTNNIVHEA